jgi:predicted permease
MKRIRELLVRTATLFSRRKHGKRLLAEIEDHIAFQTEDNIRAGMPPSEARREALLQFGAVEAMKEAYRDQESILFMENLLRDLKYGVRQLRRSPGFTIVAVLTLALGIGANTALFTVVDAVLLKPLPVREPGQLLLMVWDSANHTMPMAGGYSGSAGSDYSTTGNLEGTSFPHLAFERMRDTQGTFSHVFAFAPSPQLDVIVEGKAHVATGQCVTGDYFQGLGVRAWRGRLLTAADEASGAAPAAVITWEYWQRRLGGEASVIGKNITINNARFTIVGVTPPGFAGALELNQTADITLPLATLPLAFPENPVTGNAGLWWLHIMARLQPGVTREQAQARMDPIFKQSALDAWRASAHKEDAVITAKDYPTLFVNPGAQGDEFARRQYRRPLLLLMGVVGLVLLIACTNTAGLLLARSSARQQEFAMRVALGARRTRLARQLLTECLLLAGIAGIAGSLLAVWGTELLLRWTEWIRGTATLQTGVDTRVLGFAVATTMLTGLLFGIFPALRAARIKLAPNMKLQLGNTGRQRISGGRLLIVAQVAISLVVLMGAGLFLRTLRNLYTVDPGFDRHSIMLFRIKPQAAGYNATTIGPLYDRMLERLSAIPGVESASLSRQPLLSSTHLARSIYVTSGDPNNGEIAEVNIVSPSFFGTMRMPILLGRRLLGSDTSASARAVVVNETFVRKFFPGMNPIGKQFWMGGGGEGTGNPLRKHLDKPPVEQPLQIVGIARDAKYTDLRSRIGPTAYLPYAQFPTLEANFEVRYQDDETAVATAERDTVRQIDPKLPLFDLRTQMEQSNQSMSEERMFANLSSCIGGLALLLASIGLFGMLSYTVRRRTPEIGIRMALGAQRSAVLGMVLRESFVLVAIGVALGIPLALASARAASSVLVDLLFGVQPADAQNLGIATAILLAIALLAGFIPARRAARVDPTIALRYE